MKHIARLLMFFISGIERHGFMFIVSLVYPVYWEQDLDLRNRGYDTLSLISNGRQYHRSTYWGSKFV